MKAALTKLHIAVFLWGFTGVLGKAIELNEGLLVWYRMAITVISLLLWLSYQRSLEIPPIKVMLKLMGIGVLVALHWVCFYGSIKYANVSIALVCFAATGVFTALLEPVLTNKKIVLIELLLGSLGLAGIYLIFHFDTQYRTGIIIGIISTLLCVVFSILNKKAVAQVASKTVMFYELTGGLLALTALMPLYLHYLPTVKFLPSLKDWLWLIVLSWLCTIYAMYLSLQNISIYT
jgi:drug/metabolite transporter (DMT)-like permease